VIDHKFDPDNHFSIWTKHTPGGWYRADPSPRTLIEAAFALGAALENGPFSRYPTAFRVQRVYAGGLMDVTDAVAALLAARVFSSDPLPLMDDDHPLRVWTREQSKNHNRSLSGIVRYGRALTQNLGEMDTL